MTVSIRFEKLDLRNLDAPHVLDGIAGRSYLPPSLLPEEEPLPALPAALPPPPSFNEQQVKNVEQEAYRKGFMEGTKEGHMQAQDEQADIDKQLTEMTAPLAERIASMLQSHAQFMSEQKTYLTQLALTIAQKVAGEALQTNALPVIEGMVLPCVERILGAPQIVVTVNERLAPTLEKRLQAHFANHTSPSEISIHGDAALATGDCRIDWSNGHAVRSTDALWQDIQRLLGAAPLAPTAPSAPAPQAAAPAIPPAAEEIGAPAEEAPLSEAAQSLRDAIGDAPLIDPSLLNDTPNEGE